MKRQVELWLLTWPHTFSVMLLFCNRNYRNLITLENRFYHVILASNIGNHTCLEHYAGIRGIVLCVHHPRHSTPQYLYNSSTNICVCALYELYCAGLQRYTFITDIHIYIYMYMPHTVYGTMPPKKIPNKTASSIVKKSVGDSARWQWETFASMQLTSASACKNFQSMCAMVDCPPVKKNIEEI